MKITIKLIEQFNFGTIKRDSLDTETRTELQRISEQADLKYRPSNGATRHYWKKKQQREFAQLAKSYL